jgi:signal peptidase II
MIGMGVLLKRKKYILWTLSIFMINFAVDRVTKILAVKDLKGADVVRFPANLILLVYTENGGAFLSLGANWNIYLKYAVLLILPLAVCLIIMVYLMFREEDLKRLVMISCIIGGGAGNLLDRLFNNFFVVDFINAGIGRFRTGILNLADISVTFGVIALLLYEFFSKPGRDGEQGEVESGE